MAHNHDPLAHAQHTAHEWLNVVAAHLGTDDRDYTYRSLRAWLHLVRDRLSVDTAAHLAAQLPELLRGVYFEGWVPSRVPIRCDVNQFARRFAREAGISVSDVPRSAAAVSAALRDRFSPGQLEHVFGVLPAGLRGELEGDAPASPVNRTSAKQVRLEALEDSVRALTEAVSALARGLEELPIEEPSGSRAAKSAQEAHRILMAHGAVEPRL